MLTWLQGFPPGKLLGSTQWRGKTGIFPPKMQSQLSQYSRRGLQLHSVQSLGLSPSPPVTAREIWEPGKQQLSLFPSGCSTDITWLWFLLLGAGTAPPPGRNPSPRCSLGPSQLPLPVQVLLEFHQEVGGRWWWGSWVRLAPKATLRMPCRRQVRAQVPWSTFNPSRCEG